VTVIWMWMYWCICTTNETCIMNSNAYVSCSTSSRLFFCCELDGWVSNFVLLMSYLVDKCFICMFHSPCIVDIEIITLTSHMCMFSFLLLCISMIILICCEFIMLMKSSNASLHIFWPTLRVIYSSFTSLPSLTRFFLDTRSMFVVLLHLFF